MRLSNNLMYQSGISKILENQTDVSNAQERVNTGQKYLTASEAPAAISQGMSYTDKIQANEQYIKSINQLGGRLNTEESVLHSINFSIQEAQELALQAGNGAYTQTELEGLAIELEGIQQTILNLTSTRSEDGKYIFSGYQDGTQPYKFDSVTQRYTYEGDQGQHKMTVTDGISIKSSDNGFDIFEKADARLNITSNIGVVSGSVTNGSVYVDKQGVFDQFHKDNYNSDPNAGATINTYNVVITAGVSPVGSALYEIQRDGVSLVPAITGQVTDEPIEFAGMKIEFEGTAPGQLDFTLEKPGKENVLNTLQSLITGLNAGKLEGEDYQQLLADAVVQLQNASEQVVFTEATLGARMNALENITDSNLVFNIQNESNRSDLIEVDMAAAISELTKQETSLQASQATFGRLSSLSLFDYI